MKILSPQFKNGQLIPSRYTCDDENINPPFEISEIPPEVVSLVLIMDDPDAPVGLWNHWLIWNIAPDTTMIEENSVPKGGTEGTNSGQKIGYSGPCPPSGTHRYFFRLYGLDKKLDISSPTTRQELEKAMANHIIAQAELMGRYARK